MREPAQTKTRLGRLGGPSFVWSSLGHFLFHVLTALYLVIVLSIEDLWHRPYDDLIGIWTAGAFLIGAGAPVAGWLSDRWNEAAMMTVYFVGIGAATVACGLAPDELVLELALAMLGLFGAIYHTVGTAWVTRCAKLRGKAMAWLGASGVLGAASASLIAGLLIEMWGWRVAFILPGGVSIVVGIVLACVCLTRGFGGRRRDAIEEPEPTRSEMRRALVALVIAMSLATVAYYAFTTVLPKWIDHAIGAQLGQNLLGIGAIVTAIYSVGVAAQFAGGHLADRGFAKAAYVASYVLKFVAFAFAAAANGWWAVAAAVAVVLAFDVAAPVEIVLIARFTSSARRGLAFGIRNGIAMAAGPLGVQLVASLWDGQSDVNALLIVLALMVLVIVVAASFVPTDRSSRCAAD